MLFRNDNHRRKVMLMVNTRRPYRPNRISTTKNWIKLRMRFRKPAVLKRMQLKRAAIRNIPRGNY